jgi:hypothetical protein
MTDIHIATIDMKEFIQWNNDTPSVSKRSLCGSKEVRRRSNPPMYKTFTFQAEDANRNHYWYRIQPTCDACILLTLSEPDKVLCFTREEILEYEQITEILLNEI